MNANIMASTFLQRGKVPIVADDDRQAARFAFRAIGPTTADRVRIARIRSTLHLEELYVSPAVLAELRGRASIEVTSPPRAPFDERGELFPFEAE